MLARPEVHSNSGMDVRSVDEVDAVDLFHHQLHQARERIEAFAAM
jgi:hypothetical protein